MALKSVPHVAVQQDHGNVGGKAGGQLGAGHVGRHHDHPVHAAAHGAHGELDLAPPVVRAAEQQVVAALLRLRVHPPDDLAEELAEQVGKHHAKDVGAAGDEAAGGSVRQVAQLRRRGFHAAPHLLAHRPGAVERARNRGHRHARPLRHVTDGDAHNQQLMFRG